MLSVGSCGFAISLQTSFLFEQSLKFVDSWAQKFDTLEVLAFEGVQASTGYLGISWFFICGCGSVNLHHSNVSLQVRSAAASPLRKALEAHDTLRVLATYGV